MGRSSSDLLSQKYSIADEIGRGASGVVFKALNLQTGAFVAIKEVTLRGVSKDQLQLLQREIDLLKLLENPYIVEYRESFNTKDTLYIVMEFVENGSLSTMLKKYGRLPEALVGVYTVQVLGGLHYLVWAAKMADVEKVAQLVQPIVHESEQAALSTQGLLADLSMSVSLLLLGELPTLPFSRTVHSAYSAVKE